MDHIIMMDDDTIGHINAHPNLQTHACARAHTQPVQDYAARTPGGRDELLAHTVPTFINVKQACEARGTSLVSTCGDGIKASDEGCDDGNAVDGDGCSSECAVEAGFEYDGMA
jgi:cysteine-rich repeat protein